MQVWSVSGPDRQTQDISKFKNKTHTVMIKVFALTQNILNVANIPPSSFTARKIYSDSDAKPGNSGPSYVLRSQSDRRRSKYLNSVSLCREHLQMDLPVWEITYTENWKV